MRSVDHYAESVKNYHDGKRKKAVYHLAKALGGEPNDKTNFAIDSIMNPKTEAFKLTLIAISRVKDGLQKSK